MDMLNSFRRWRNYRRTVSELSALTTRELDDLGITRGEIRMVAAKKR